MNHRGLSALLLVMAATSGVCQFLFSSIRSVTYDTDQIHRQDSKRKSTYRLAKDRYIEFQLLPGATTLRLMTNAALNTVDAPDYDLSNPRVGWKYAIDYQLLNESGEVLREEEYHFRSPVRQLIDQQTREPIYPLFFGHDTLVATQTRTMQIALNESLADAQRFRVRLRDSSPQIESVVTRVVARVERENYGDRTKWMKIPLRQRKEMTKYCVYDHDMLTSQQRRNLLRWRWEKCIIVGEAEKWNLFSIGDIDDEEVRPEQLPEGQYCDPQLFGSIPLPEGQASLRLRFNVVSASITDAKDKASPGPDYVTIEWYGPQYNERKTELLPLSQSLRTSNDKLPSSIGASPPDTLESVEREFEMEVDGGLVILKPSTRVVVRADWIPKNQIAAKQAELLRSQLPLPSPAERLTMHVTENDQSSRDEAVEITPPRKVLRTYLVGEQPLEYAITHSGNDPTPFKFQVRVPHSELFENTFRARTSTLSLAPHFVAPDPVVEIQWKALDVEHNVLDSGTLSDDSVMSTYDFLLMNSQRESLSDPLTYYFELPKPVKYLQFSSTRGLYLGNAQVRPHDLTRIIKLPEDWNSFSRRQSTNRSWFGLNPVDRTTMMRDNRTFVITLRDRPPETECNLEERRWQRYEPEGNWIGTQLLVPKTDATEAAEQSQPDESIHSYFKIDPNRRYLVSKHQPTNSLVAADDRMSIVVSATESVGNLQLKIGGETIASRRMLSSHGLWRIDLPDFATNDEFEMEILCNEESQLYVHGLHVKGAPEFYRRTAQRLDLGSLTFPIERRQQVEEYLTLRMFNRNPKTQFDRLRFHVQVELADSDFQDASLNRKDVWTEAPTILKGQTSENTIPQTKNGAHDGNAITPQVSWTPMSRVFDLRAETEGKAILLDNGQMTGEGYRCLVRFGEELPVGSYRVHVKAEDASFKAAVLVYQMQPEETSKPILEVVRSPFSISNSRSLPSQSGKQ